MTIEATIIPNKLQKKDIPDEVTLTYDTVADRVKIKDAGVTETQLADSSVSTLKLKDSAVTNRKIATNTIRSFKIYDVVTNGFVGNSTGINHRKTDDSTGLTEVVTQGATTNHIFYARLTTFYMNGNSMQIRAQLTNIAGTNSAGANTKWGFFVPETNEADVNNIIFIGSGICRVTVGGTSTDVTVTFPNPSLVRIYRITRATDGNAYFYEGSDTDGMTLLATVSLGSLGIGLPPALSVKDGSNTREGIAFKILRKV